MKERWVSLSACLSSHLCSPLATRGSILGRSVLLAWPVSPSHGSACRSPSLTGSFGLGPRRLMRTHLSHVLVESRAIYKPRSHFLISAKTQANCSDLAGQEICQPHVC